ncbi:capsular polysaccharide export protein, LipB/KpsS family [Vibrio campbellii]
MILYYADNIDRAKFWIAISKLLEESYDSVFYTNELNVFLYLKGQGIRVKLIRDVCGRDKVNCSEAETVRNNYEYISGDLTYQGAVSLYRKSYNFFINENLEKFTYAFIWNGESLISKAIVASFNDLMLKVKFRFFEISNLPGKVFVDFQGTNGKSAYYNNFHVVNESLYDERVNDDYDSWLKSYVLNEGLPKQVKKKGMFPFIKTILNEGIKHFGYLFLSIPKRSSNGLLRTVFNSYVFNFKKNASYQTDSLKLEDGCENVKYFIPFQVSNDTQLLINSNVDNMDLLKSVIVEAKKSKAKVIAKIHPAEENADKVEQLITYGEKHGVVFMNNTNSNSIISSVDKVFTINSTVGLQSKILGKEVEVFGNALYKNFSQRDLKVFITRFLINIDYFEPESIKLDQVKRLL